MIAPVIFIDCVLCAELFVGTADEVHAAYVGHDCATIAADACSPRVSATAGAPRRTHGTCVTGRAPAPIEPAGSPSREAGRHRRQTHPAGSAIAIDRRCRP